MCLASGAYIAASMVAIVIRINDKFKSASNNCDNSNNTTSIIRNLPYSGVYFSNELGGDIFILKICIIYLSIVIISLIILFILGKDSYNIKFIHKKFNRFYPFILRY